MNGLDTAAEDTDEQKVESQVFPVRVDKWVGEVPPGLPGSVPAIGMRAKISSVMDTSAPYFGQHNPNLKTYDSEQCQKV